MFADLAMFNEFKTQQQTQQLVRGARCTVASGGCGGATEPMLPCRGLGGESATFSSICSVPFHTVAVAGLT